MTTYFVVAKTKNKELVETIQDVLNGIESDEIKFETHEAPDDPGQEEGKNILWYFSESHKKARYYAGPPPGPMQKPLWSYDKKDAVGLSDEACKITKDRLDKIGYKTPMELDKLGPKLGVVEGGKKDEPKPAESESGPFAADDDTQTGDGFMRFYGATQEQIDECIMELDSGGHFDDLVEYDQKPLLASVNPLIPKGTKCTQVDLTFDSVENAEKWKQSKASQEIYMKYASTIKGADFTTVDHGDVTFKTEAELVVVDELEIKENEITSIEFAPGDGLTDDEANAMPTGKDES